jgi:hypothetical protein
VSSDSGTIKFHKSRAAGRRPGVQAGHGRNFSALFLGVIEIGIGFNHFDFDFDSDFDPDT